MADRLRPLKLFGKWVVVPVALCVVGYYVVGPRIGSRVSDHIKQMAGDQFTMLNKQVHKIVTPAPQAGSAKQAPVESKPPAPAPATFFAQPDSGGPEVQVSVRSQTSGRTAIRADGTVVPRKHRVHRKPKAKPKPKPESTDEGSYGGTQDQGTTTGGGAADPPTGG